MSDEFADPVQPVEGQGGEAGGDSPYAEYLSRIPEEVRGDVEPVFKDWDANTTRRFQEAAEYKRGWEPFEKMGVNQRDPEVVEWGLQMAELAMNNPAEIQKWYETYAKENGLTAAEAQEALETEYVDPAVAELRQQQQAIAAQLEQMTSWRDTREQEDRVAQAQAQIRSEIDGLKAKHGDEFNEELVGKFLAQYIDTDPANAVQKAFADTQAVKAQIQKEWVESKTKQPAAAMTGGTANGAPDARPEGADILKWAADQALQQMRGSNNT